MKKQKVKVSKEQFDGMIKDTDINGEGKIEYDGFALVMKKIERSRSCFICINAIT